MIYLFCSVQPLPGGVTHNYILPGAAWEVPAQTGTVVDSIPFTHPAHIPALLELLRHQCTVNTLLRTCMASQYARTGRTVFPPHNWFTCSKLDRRKGGNRLWGAFFFFFEFLLPGLMCDLHYEVLPESETSFSVTFHRPDSNSLAVCEHFLQIIIEIKVSVIRLSLRAAASKLVWSFCFLFSKYYMVYNFKIMT